MSSQIEIIENILRDGFSMKGFVSLVSEILDSLQIVSPDRFHMETESYSTHIDGYTHVGNYVDPAGKRIAVFSVKLKTSSFVENARNAQRNYIRKLIIAGNCDAALVAFYSSAESKWRLSFVRLDYKMKFEGGKFTTTEEMTPAKRYSFLVGKDEPCYTAISRLFNLIIDKNYNPTVDEIEEVFSVENVTKEFFELYSEKYYQLQEYLEKNDDFVEEAKRCGFSSEQFAKKLLGQIVFLYFLQKKGWMGINVWPSVLSSVDYNSVFESEGNSSRGQLVKQSLPIIYVSAGNGLYIINRKGFDEISDDAEEIIAEHMPITQNWGDGSKEFMRQAFDFAKEEKKPFYECILKSLFYDSLNKNRGELSYYPVLHCRVPFLSGGLFEPIDGYDWKNTHFNIPDEFFSNKKNEHDYGANGILDIFDRYNFTICEDEPMEREVAIDPEMLGKVFENLLEVKDRKTKGVYYTPREIVHYICQGSLISYLTRKTCLCESDIRDFVLFGNFMRDEDTDKRKRLLNGGLKISDSLFMLDDNNNILINKLTEIDNALASVKIVDPAVGSGAFLLCMVNEIVRIRQNIAEYLTIGMSEVDKKLLYLNERTAYWLKYDTIKNCIFAVDIEPSAVDIAQLRLWLSLIIDTEINPNAKSPMDGFSGPVPLPTLDSNILCGDSLIDQIEGTQLFTVEDIRDKKFSSLIDRLIDEQKKLFVCDDPIKKGQLKMSIQAYKNLIIAQRAGSSLQNIVNDYKEAAQKPSKPFTIWPLDFARIFKENDGFDIVIGNPPYVQLQKSISPNSSEKIGDRYSKLGYDTFVKTGDLYCLFYELGISLLHDKGCLSFITSNKWMRTDYGNQLRSYFAYKINPKVLIDFSGIKVFETAQVDVSILHLEKSKNEESTKVCTIKEPCEDNLAGYIKDNSSTMSFLDGSTWNILSSIDENILGKLSAVGKPLSEWNICINYGIKTGLNSAYVIDGNTKRQLCIEDPVSDEIIKPVLKGRDINKWEFDFKDLWLIVVHNGVNNQIPPIRIENYKAVERYLFKHLDNLKNRSDQGITPYHLRDCAYIESFALPKIIFQEMVQSPSFAFDSCGKYMCLDTARIITGERLEYLTGLFNSNLFFFSVKHFFGGGKLGGKGIRMKHTFFMNFSAYVPNENEEKYIKNIVISGGKDRDKLINNFFYTKYDLSSEEIEHIEADIKV